VNSKNISFPQRFQCAVNFNSTVKFHTFQLGFEQLSFVGYRCEPRGLGIADTLKHLKHKQQIVHLFQGEVFFKEDEEEVVLVNDQL